MCRAYGCSPPARLQTSAAAVASQSLEPQTWQKQRLMDLKLLGQGGKPACAMGRGTSAGPLTAGVDERLISGMEVLCAPDATSLKASSKLKPAVEAAGLALAQLYIEATFKGLELDAVQDQVCKCMIDVVQARCGRNASKERQCMPMSGGTTHATCAPRRSHFAGDAGQTRSGRRRAHGDPAATVQTCDARASVRSARRSCGSGRQASSLRRCRQCDCLSRRHGKAVRALAAAHNERVCIGTRDEQEIVVR